MTKKEKPVVQDNEQKSDRYIETVRELGTEGRGSAFAAAIGLILKLPTGGPELAGHDQ